MLTVWHYVWAISAFIGLYLDKIRHKYQKMTDYFQRKSYGPYLFHGEVLDLGKDVDADAYIVVLKLEKGSPMLLKQGLEKTGQRMVFTTTMERIPTESEVEAAKRLTEMAKSVPYTIGGLNAEQNL